MKPEKYNPTPEETKTAEQIMSPEQRLASDLRERVLSERFEAPEPVSEAIKEKLEKDVDDVSGIFEKGNHPWFFGGGVALELHQGNFQRNHGDYDIRVYEEDVHEFIEPIRDSGYELFHVVPDKEDMIATEPQIASDDNFHLRKIDKDKPGPEYIDLWVLRHEKNSGDIVWDKEKNMTLPKSLFENTSEYSSIGGKTVPLEPKEVLILNKLFGERQLDLEDLKMFLPTLTLEERERLDAILKSNDVTFDVSNQKISDVDELLKLLEVSTREAKGNFLVAKIDEMISKNRERFDDTIVKTFEIAGQADTPENFLDAVKKEFGEDLINRRSDEFAEVAKFLFGITKPTLEEFRDFAYRAFNLQQFLGNELRKEAWVMPRWKVMIKGETVEK